MEYTKLRDYITSLDDSDREMIDQRVAEKGIEGYLNQQLVYLDCTRVIYALETVAGSDFDFDKEWINKLLERHQANLEYEKENPPIWYGGKKAKDKWDKEHGKHPRRKKSIEGTLPGMGKEISNKEKLKKLSAQFGNLTFKIKPPKKD